jgi:hypothetical protein
MATVERVHQRPACVLAKDQAMCDKAVEDVPPTVRSSKLRLWQPVDAWDILDILSM